MSTVRVVGVGSPWGDDQAGWLAIDALLARGVRPGDGILIQKLDRPGASLIPLLENASWVILIDAMRSDHRPGRIRRFDQQDWAGYRHGLSSHGFGVLDALSLAQAMGCLPARLELYGIEIGSTAPGDPPGIEVRAAAQELAGVVEATLNRFLSAPNA